MSDDKGKNATKQNTTKRTEGGQPKAPDSEAEVGIIDRTAPAGSDNSLGAQSVRDGRPTTDDSVVEAIDEETP